MARDPRRSRLADRDRGRTRQQALHAALGSSPCRQPRPARRRRCPATNCPSGRRGLIPPFTNHPKCSAKPLFERGFLCAFNDLRIRTVEDLSCTAANLYSITSSAIASTPDGMFRPRVLAVFRLITNSNLVGRKTGRSAGFSPLRTRLV